MKKINILIAVLIFTGFCFETQAQITLSKELMEFYTSEWKGERFPDGRPKVPDNLMQRLKNISIEDAWGVLRNEGYRNQFDGNWQILHPDQVITGRVLTAQYMPSRPDVNKSLLDKGHADGRIGASNSWPIDMLQSGDVYVADGYGKVVDGTLIGDNLGNSIYAKSGNGVIFDAGVRDLAGLEEIEGFNAFVRGYDPSFLTESMLTGINVPIRIGRAIVLPGDAVLAKKEGVIFIPAQLVEKVVITSEFISLKDQFGHQRLREGKYTPGQIDSSWSDDIRQDFLKWLDQRSGQLPMSRKELDEFMKDRTW